MVFHLPTKHQLRRPHFIFHVQHKSDLKTHRQMTLENDDSMDSSSQGQKEKDNVTNLRGEEVFFSRSLIIHMMTELLPSVNVMQ